MSLDHDQVRRLARLARIAIRPEEIDPVLDRLNRMLGLIDDMRRVDTSGVVAMAHPLEAEQRLREDKVTETEPVKTGHYLVPKVIE